MTKRRKKGGRRKQKIPLAATAGMIIGIKNLYDAYRVSPANAMMALTGLNVNMKFDWRTATATIPMVAGAGVSMVAAKSGLNRYIKIPYIKL